MNPGDILGNYRIVRLLGQGGMGAVYEAVHEAIERRVAIKLLHAGLAKDRDAVNRFFNEARATNRIDHPSIVQVSDFGHAPNGASYLVMEFLRGSSLAKRLADIKAAQQKMDVATALQIAWQVADALTVAHSAGIVHRDLKPENLMLIDDPIAPSGERVKILDFGIAKLTGHNTLNKAHTAVDALMGTPVYMSPEQCEGAGGVDEKSDVYSLGVILFEMLAGRPPFEAQGIGQLIMAHMTQSPPPLLDLSPSVPKGVADFVHVLLSKAKAERPSMQQVQERLSDLLASVSGAVPSLRRRMSGNMGLLDAPSRRSARGQTHNTLGQSLGQKLRSAGARPASLAGIALGLIGLGALSLLWLRSPRPATPKPDPVANTAGASAGAKPSPAATEPAAVPPAVQPKPAAVTWVLDSTPAGAEVVDENGQVLGQTPWTHTRQASAGETPLRLQKKGFEPLSLTVPNEKDSRQSLSLAAVHSEAPPKKRDKKKQKKKGLEIED
ncbi:MAG: protein kinase [Myxococcales bacterium]|nr:protein kinase [Myxococcales bacterium]